MFFEKRRQAVIFTAAGVMLGGFILLRYLPLHQKIKAVNAQIANSQLVIAKAASEKEQMESARNEFFKLQSQAENFDKNVPEQRDIGGFLQQINGLMDKHNLKEQLMEPGSEISAEGLKCIPISMQCKGKLKQIFSFYKSLHDIDRAIRIEQLKLKNDNDLSGEVSMQTKAVIYYRPCAERG